MKLKNILITAAMLLPVAGVASAAPLTGFYQTIDDETNLPKSIVALYEYTSNDDDDVLLAGRIVALCDDAGAVSETLANPIKSADKVKGAPKYTGLDIIWDMEWESDDNEYEDGKIMDPKNGKIYSSVIWQDKDTSKLQVRGKIGPFGRTQTWNVVSVESLPTEIQNLDTKTWKPIIRD